MFIRNCINETRDLVTLSNKTTIDNALEIMKKNNLKSVPVIDDKGLFIGIFSKEALFEVFEDGFTGTCSDLKKESIESAINYNIKPLFIDSKFEDLLPIIVRFPFVPIVDEERQLLGIVKRKEITRALESSFGVGVPGIRILIGTAEMEGRLEKILEITHQLHLNVITAMAFDAEDRFNRRVLLKIQRTDMLNELTERLEKNGFKILTVHND